MAVSTNMHRLLWEWRTILRFSCWLTIYHFPINTKADSLIVHLKRLFMSYGVPEEISRDGRPQFSSSSFNIFLKDWGFIVDSLWRLTLNQMVEQSFHLAVCQMYYFGKHSERLLGHWLCCPCHSSTPQHTNSKSWNPFSQTVTSSRLAYLTKKRFILS